jgi:16S rRNA (cytosine1402-N4)-methyltransferase
MAVISFHSLEDRIVKRFIKQQIRGDADEVPSYIPLQATATVPRLRSLGRAIQPGPAETEANPRARSAVLRVAEKLV